MFKVRWKRVLVHLRSETTQTAGFIFIALVVATFAYYLSHGLPTVTRERIARTLEVFLNSNQFPPVLEFQSGKKIFKTHVRYTLDEVVQTKIEKLFKSYRPDYGAFVAVDAVTGRILSLVSYQHEPWRGRINLTLRAAFPAASVFKIVTASAAIDQHKVTPDTVFAFNGANHTLYRRNVTQNTTNRWTRRMTLKEAFGKSVNTVFGKLGLFVMKAPDLEEYARRFQFNQTIPADVPVQPGSFALRTNDDFGVAEAASGFHREILMSPLQGALIAAAVANDGVIMQPSLVESIFVEDGRPLYQFQPKPLVTTMTPETAYELRLLMSETVERGTSRTIFRQLLKRRDFADVEMGGKTGSLRGKNPKGKCDWFVGYAYTGGRRVALAALTVNEDVWRVKSSYVARYFIENYFKPPK